MNYSGLRNSKCLREFRYLHVRAWVFNVGDFPWPLLYAYQLTNWLTSPGKQQFFNNNENLDRGVTCEIIHINTTCLVPRLILLLYTVLGVVLIISLSPQSQDVEIIRLCGFVCACPRELPSTTEQSLSGALQLRDDKREGTLGWNPQSRLRSQTLWDLDQADL